MEIRTLTDDNFVFFAHQHYRNPQCVSIEEFQKDLTIFKYIQKCLGRYIKTGKITERLIFNYLIFLNNLFGIEAMKKMLEYKISPDYWPAMKPFLVYLNYVDGTEYTHIKMDPVIIEKLREFRENGK